MKKLTDLELLLVSGGESEDEMLPDDCQVNLIIWEFCEKEKEGVDFQLD